MPTLNAKNIISQKQLEKLMDVNIDNTPLQTYIKLLLSEVYATYTELILNFTPFQPLQ